MQDFEDQDIEQISFDDFYAMVERFVLAFYNEFEPGWVRAFFEEYLRGKRIGLGINLRQDARPRRRSTSSLELPDGVVRFPAKRRHEQILARDGARVVDLVINPASDNDLPEYVPILERADAVVIFKEGLEELYQGLAYCDEQVAYEWMYACCGMVSSELYGLAHAKLYRYEFLVNWILP